VANHDVNSLTGILELASDALSRVRLETSQPEFGGQS
jgi:hypothetical protein